jgi:hypothetical protein
MSNKDEMIKAIQDQQADLDAKRAAAKKLTEQIMDAERRGGVFGQE